MKPIWIHIGLHKTGTSYLQSFFCANEDALAKRGICYPKTGRVDDGHYALSANIGSEDSLNGLFQSMAEETELYGSVLISSEDLSGLFLDVRKLALFVKIAGRYFSPRMVIYLRRQDELKESIYAQIVRDWFQGDMDDETHYIYDHFERLSRIWKIVPKADIVIRAYDTTLWPSNRLELDFLSIFDIRDSVDFAMVPSKNITQNRRITVFLSRLDKSSLTRNGLFLQYLQKEELIRDDKVKYLWSPERRRTFLARYESSNLQLCREADLPGGGQFLLSAPDHDESWEPAEPISDAEMMALLTSLWNDFSQSAFERAAARDELAAIKKRADKKILNRLRRYLHSTGEVD
jgi:hypothetical protein